MRSRARGERGSSWLALASSARVRREPAASDLAGRAFEAFGQLPRSRNAPLDGDAGDPAPRCRRTSTPLRKRSRRRVGVPHDRPRRRWRSPDGRGDEGTRSKRKRVTPGGLEGLIEPRGKETPHRPGRSKNNEACRLRRRGPQPRRPKSLRAAIEWQPDGGNPGPPSCGEDGWMSARRKVPAWGRRSSWRVRRGPSARETWTRDMRAPRAFAQIAYPTPAPRIGCQLSNRWIATAGKAAQEW